MTQPNDQSMDLRQRGMCVCDTMRAFVSAYLASLLSLQAEADTHRWCHAVFFLEI